PAAKLGVRGWRRSGHARHPVLPLLRVTDMWGYREMTERKLRQIGNKTAERRRYAALHLPQLVLGPVEGSARVGRFGIRKHERGDLFDGLGAGAYANGALNPLEKRVESLDAHARQEKHDPLPVKKHEITAAQSFGH